MVIYSIPAAVVLLIGRDWYLFNVMSKMGVFTDTHYTGKSKNPFLTFDLWAFCVLCFGSFSWGGLINRGKKDSVISFIFGQLWFVLMIIIAFVFLNAKDLNKTSYMYIFFMEIIKKSWVLHLVNYIPIPPFDASFFYAQRADLHKVVILSKMVMTMFIFFFPITNDFISGQSFLKFIGIS